VSALLRRLPVPVAPFPTETVTSYVTRLACRFCAAARGTDWSVTQETPLRLLGGSISALDAHQRRTVSRVPRKGAVR